MLPATRRVGEAAARMQCMNSLKQLMLALHSYKSTGITTVHPAPGRLDARDREAFPPGCIGTGTVPEERLSWMVALLPFLEQGSAYQKFDIEKGYAENLPAAKSAIKLFHCPSANEAGTDNLVTNYVAMSGIGPTAAGQAAGAAGNGFMGYDRKTSSEMIKDGTSNTIALMETRSGLGPWAHGGASNVRGFDPADQPWCGDQRPFEGHSNGINAAMADGSVRFIRSSVDPKTLAAAITIAGGESIDLD
ncbi:MAG TPA: DUF1559 domain-containing protein [Fimbriiglobus sp.]